MSDDDGEAKPDEPPSAQMLQNRRELPDLYARVQPDSSHLMELDDQNAELAEKRACSRPVWTRIAAFEQHIANKHKALDTSR